MNADEKITEILRSQVADLDPSPAAWDAIQSRRHRRRLGQRAVTAATVLLTAAAVLTGIVLTAGDAPDDEPAPAASDPAVVRRGHALPVVWPLTTREDVAAWESNPQSHPALTSPSAAADAFVRDFLQLTDVSVASADAAAGTVWFEARRAGSPVGEIALTQNYGNGGNGPWLVTQAKFRDALSVDPPSFNVVVPSPLTISGLAVNRRGNPGPNLRVTMHDPGTGDLLASAVATVDGDRWQARLDWAPQHQARPHGPVAAVTVQAFDGENPLTFAAAPVRVAADSVAPQPSSSSSPSMSEPPERYVAAVGTRLAVIDRRTGRLVRWLTEEQPGGGSHDPAVSSDGTSVVFAQGSGTCSSRIQRVDRDGGPATTLVPAGTGALFLPTSQRGLAYARTRCESGDVELVVDDVDDGTPRVVRTIKAPGGVASVIYDSRFLTVVTDQGLVSIDTTGELADTSYTPPRAGCRVARATATDELFYVVEQCGASARLLSFEPLSDLRSPTELGSLGDVDVQSIDVRDGWLIVGGVRGEATRPDARIYDLRSGLRPWPTPSLAPELVALGGAIGPRWL